jgi:mono/diheme cytochrome c family protein
MKRRVTNRSSFHCLSILSVIAWLAVFGAARLLGQAAPQPATGEKTVNDGVYAAAQADRGQALFAGSCSTCHDPARFTGDDFLGSWTGKPLHALFELISATMPEDNPGSLKPQQYADVISYFLRLNKFPAGDKELEGTADAMRAIKIDKKAQ